MQNIGAGRLCTIMETVFEPVSYDAPDLRGKTIAITGAYVRQRLDADERKGWFSF